MKVLAQIKKHSGSSYHRVLTPLMGWADFAEVLDSKLVGQYDVLWLNRSSEYIAPTLSMWKSMFPNLRIVFDLDDSFKVEKYHLNNKSISNGNSNIMEKLKVVDWIVVSTPELEKEFKEYGFTNISMIPNRLPFGKGQFVRKEETLEQFMNRKIRVGFVGSFYHNANWSEIKGWLNRLVNHPTFKQEAEFIMCGYHESAHKTWEEFIPLGKVRKSLAIDQYIEHYHHVDILIAPLRDDWFNRCRSSLKVLEASCGPSLCVLDSIYSEKTDIPDIIDTGHKFVNNDKDWFQIPLNLIENKEELYKLIWSTSDKVMQIPFNEAVEKRVHLAKYLKDNPKTIEIKDQIYSIKYDPEQPAEYEEVFNKVNSVEEKSYLFEYNVLTKIKVREEDKWVGAFSWKFPSKTRLTKAQVKDILDQSRGKYDIINFCQPLNKPYLAFTEFYHKGFYAIFKPLCEDLGLKVKEPNHTIYSNFFVLRGDLFKEYQALLDKAIFLLETKYSYHAWKDANYINGLPHDKLKKYTGLDYYTFHTFVLERILSVWVDNKRLKCLDIFKPVKLKKKKR